MGRVVGRIFILICLCIVWSLRKTLETQTLRPTQHPDVPLAFWPTHRTRWPLGAQPCPLFWSGALSPAAPPALVSAWPRVTLCVHSYPSPPSPPLFLFPPKADTGDQMPCSCDAHHRPLCVPRKAMASLQPSGTAPGLQCHRYCVSCRGCTGASHDTGFS